MYPQALSLIAQAAINIGQADMATVQLASAGALQLAATPGFGKAFQEFFAVVHARESACGAALQTGQPVIVDDVRTSPHFLGKPSLGAMLDAGSLAVVSVPIVSRAGILLGMVSPHRRSIGRPAPDTLKQLSWLARQAGELLEGTASQSTLRGLEVLARR